jgi:hypothetical protein
MIIFFCKRLINGLVLVGQWEYIAFRKGQQWLPREIKPDDMCSHCSTVPTKAKAYLSFLVFFWGLGHLLDLSSDGWLLGSGFLLSWSCKKDLSYKLISFNYWISLIQHLADTEREILHVVSF